jgi:two-component system response regulator DesR
MAKLGGPCLDWLEKRGSADGRHPLTDPTGMPSARSTLRVLVVDDRPLGDALLSALADDADLSCVSRVTNLSTVTAEAERHAADVVLLNHLFAGAALLQVVGDLAERLPRIRVLVLSEVASESLARESLRRGASGFLVHSGNVETLVPRIRACTGHAPVARGVPA